MVKERKKEMKTKKIRIHAHSWCLDVVCRFCCYFTSTPSNTFPPSSSTSNNEILLFHGGQEASTSASGGIHDDIKTYQIYNVVKTYRGRPKVRESEVPQREMLAFT